MSGFPDAIAALYAEAERLRDAGQKKKAAGFAEAACFLELRKEPEETCGQCGAVVEGFHACPGLPGEQDW